MSIKLSICIPTYNRGQFIGQTLESAIKQKTKEVEIVIVDDGSNDNTKEIVRFYQKKRRSIRYYYRKLNYGIDRGMVQAVELAQGEYCWLMSSDDIIKQGAIPTILEACKKGYKLIVINSEIKNFDLSKKLKDRVLNINKDLVYDITDWEKFFIKTANHLSFMPAVVIKRDLWISRKKEEYYGTEFLHVGVIFQKPIPGKILVIAEPLLTDRFGNFTWAPRKFEFSMLKWPNLIWSFGEIPEDVKKKVCSRGDWKDILRLLYLKASGSLTADNIEAYIRNYKTSKPRKIFVKMIPYFPAKVVNFIALLYYLFFQKSKEKAYLLKNCPAYCFKKST